MFLTQSEGPVLTSLLKHWMGTTTNQTHKLVTVIRFQRDELTLLEHPTKLTVCWLIRHQQFKIRVAIVCLSTYVSISTTAAPKSATCDSLAPVKKYNSSHQLSSLFSSLAIRWSNLLQIIKPNVNDGPQYKSQSWCVNFTWTLQLQYRNSFVSFSQHSFIIWPLLLYVFGAKCTCSTFKLACNCGRIEAF